MKRSAEWLAHPETRALVAYLEKQLVQSTADVLQCARESNTARVATMVARHDVLEELLSTLK